MSKKVRRLPNPFHPGEFLLDRFLAPGNISQAEFARKMGWRKERLNKLIKARCGVTAEAALDLADALGTSPKLWMLLQAKFDLAAAERKRGTALW
jgi:antitoxin HigA-1